jgi:hypothetical protein
MGMPPAVDVYSCLYGVRQFIGVNKKYSNSIMKKLRQVPFRIIPSHNISFNSFILLCSYRESELSDFLLNT